MIYDSHHFFFFFFWRRLFKIGASRTAIAVKKALGIWIFTKSKKGGVITDIKGAVYFYQLLKLARIEKLAEVPRY